MKKIALISYILLCNSNIFSQNIIGKVTNINNIPIENVNISTKNGIRCSTDNQGNYILNLSKGNHIIIFQHVSFSKQDISVKLSKGEKKTLNVILLENTNNLQFERDIINFIDPRSDKIGIKIIVNINKFEKFLSKYNLDEIDSDIYRELLIKNLLCISIIKLFSLSTIKKSAINLP